MKKVLYILIPFVFAACGQVDEEYEMAKEPSNIIRPVYVMPSSANTCGGAVPCDCGSILTSDRKMDSNDKIMNCDWNTPVPALYVKNGAKLDCNGRMISVRLDSKGNYENNRTAIFIRYDSSGSAVSNCHIYGFGDDAIYVEMRQDWVKKDGKTVFEFESPKNLAFINNDIKVGSGKCYTSSCGASNGIRVQGWPGNSDPPKNILLAWNRFGMAQSVKTDDVHFLHYGSYFMTSGAKNVQIWFNTFDDLHWGFGLRLLYGVEAWIVGNIFRMPWERNQQTKMYKSKCGTKSPCSAAYWMPSGMALELYNGAKYGYPKFLAWFNIFYISEDPYWPPTPFGSGYGTGLNHEHVVIRAAPGATLPKIDMRFNWWKRLNGANYADSELTRLVYDKNYTVYGKKVEPAYREVIIQPRLY